MNEQLEQLIKQHGSLSVTYDRGGGGMGLYFGACLGNKWPFCSGGTLSASLADLVSTYARLEREKLQKRINEIDASSNL